MAPNLDNLTDEQREACSTIIAAALNCGLVDKLAKLIGFGADLNLDDHSFMRDKLTEQLDRVFRSRFRLGVTVELTDDETSDMLTVKHEGACFEAGMRSHAFQDVLRQHGFDDDKIREVMVATETAAERSINGVSTAA